MNWTGWRVSARWLRLKNPLGKGRRGWVCGVEVQASFVPKVQRDTTVYLDTADDQTRSRIEVRSNYFFVFFRDESLPAYRSLSDPSHCLSRTRI